MRIMPSAIDFFNYTPCLGKSQKTAVEPKS